MLESIEKFIKCPITLDFYREPVSVPCCGQNFSREYILNLEKCPCCRKFPVKFYRLTSYIIF